MNILVFNHSRLNEAHRKTLERTAPAAHFHYCAREAAPSLLAEADIIFGNLQPQLLAGCRRLRLLQLTSAGTDGYLERMPDGAVLANATGGYGLALSEHLLAMLLMLIKKLHLYSRNQAQSLWHKEGFVSAIEGSATLIVGAGDIGGEFARRMHALGAYTIGIRRTGRDKPDYLDELHGLDALDSLLPRADSVALCLPATPQTTGLLNSRRIGLMRHSAILLNVGRGSAVDQEALYAALQSGRLGGAGLDVTTPEPLPPEHPLWQAPNTIITPHIAGYDNLPETYDRIVQIAAQNIRAVLDGGKIQNEVDFSTGYRKL